MRENVATTTTSAIPDTPYRVHGRDKHYQMFDVPSEIFRRFQCGRNRFERWSKYLDCQDENQQRIYDFAKKNRKKMIVLRDSATGALRAIRRRANNEA